MDWWQWVLIVAGAWLGTGLVVLVVIARASQRVTRERDVVDDREHREDDVA